MGHLPRHQTSHQRCRTSGCASRSRRSSPSRLPGSGCQSGGQGGNPDRRPFRASRSSVRIADAFACASRPDRGCERASRSSCWSVTGLISPLPVIGPFPDSFSLWRLTWRSVGGKDGFGPSPTQGCCNGSITSRSRRCFWAGWVCLDERDRAEPFSARGSDRLSVLSRCSKMIAAEKRPDAHSELLLSMCTYSPRPRVNGSPLRAPRARYVEAGWRLGGTDGASVPNEHDRIVTGPHGPHPTPEDETPVLAGAS